MKPKLRKLNGWWHVSWDFGNIHVENSFKDWDEACGQLQFWVNAYANWYGQESNRRVK